MLLNMDTESQRHQGFFMREVLVCLLLLMALPESLCIASSSLRSAALEENPILNPRAQHSRVLAVGLEVSSSGEQMESGTSLQCDWATAFSSFFSGPKTAFTLGPQNPFHPSV